MELKITPSSTSPNKNTLKGILIEGSSVKYWLSEIQRMQISLFFSEAYAIPNQTPNSIWGCFVISEMPFHNVDLEKNIYCQLIGNVLFIPEKTSVFPKISDNELQNLFFSRKHILHPAFGLVELSEPILWEKIIQEPIHNLINILKPISSVFIPSKIKSFRIKPLDIEESLLLIEENTFPKKDFTQKPLNKQEKIKLNFYKRFFGENLSEPHKKKSLHTFLDKIFKKFSKKSENFLNHWQKDYEQLNRRNQSALKQLLDLLDKNPLEALKYAIPIDNKGIQRGETLSSNNWVLRKIWDNFSINQSNSSNSSKKVGLEQEGFFELENRYKKTAEEFINKKEFQKAAFIYMKLLKDYSLAAKALEDGYLYQDAASVYLKHLQNKSKAAECYEKGHMTLEAIELYKELIMNEKVGDLYIKLHQKDEAFVYYQKVIDEYVANNQYVKASLIYKDKMYLPLNGQNILLEGWKQNQDAYNCLNNYFANITDSDKLAKEIQFIYKNEVHATHQSTFLEILKHEYKKGVVKQVTREIAYEIIADLISTNRNYIQELITFNKEDEILIKDTIRFKKKK